jgi:hypothetical protein
MDGFFFDPVPPPQPEPAPRNPVESERHPRLRHGAQPTWNLHLETTGGHVAARFLTESPPVATLVVEDLCWQAATEDWKHRRPHWWRPGAQAAWKAEGAELAVQAERLREMADYVFRDL